MPTIKKIYDGLMDPQKDNNQKFRDVQTLLDYFHFGRRVRGDHFIYYLDGIQENINLQPAGNKAKSYQVRQIRDFLKRNGLSIKGE